MLNSLQAYKNYPVCPYVPSDPAQKTYCTSTEVRRLGNNHRALNTVIKVFMIVVIAAFLQMKLITIYLGRINHNLPLQTTLLFSSSSYMKTILDFVSYIDDLCDLTLWTCIIYNMFFHNYFLIYSIFIVNILKMAFLKNGAVDTSGR